LKAAARKRTNKYAAQSAQCGADSKLNRQVLAMTLITFSTLKPCQSRRDCLHIKFLRKGRKEDKPHSRTELRVFLGKLRSEIARAVKQHNEQY